MKFFLLFFLILSGASVFLHGDEVSVACFNRYTAFFESFPRPGGMIFSVRKIPDAEIRTLLKSGKLRLAISDSLPDNPDHFDIAELAVSGNILAVHPENPLNTISCAEASRLLAGEIASWHSLNGRENPVHIYKAAVNAPLPQFHKCPDCAHDPPDEERKGKGNRKQKEPHAMILQTENASKSFVLLFVDPDGVAQLPLTSYREDRVKLLSVNGIPPKLEYFRNGGYPLSGKIYLIASKQLTDSEKKVVSYIKSKEFARRILEEGDLPLEQKAGEE